MVVLAPSNSIRHASFGPNIAPLLKSLFPWLPPPTPQASAISLARMGCYPNGIRILNFAPVNCKWPKQWNPPLPKSAI